ncbi:MAG: Lsm family RNA-binding protein [Candidatus Bathyarchaeia archaeon]
MAALAGRRFYDELGQLINKQVQVVDSTGRVIEGVLLGYDNNTMSLCLGDVKSEKGTKIHRVFIYGSNIQKVEASERPFNLEGLVERLERVFPSMVRLYPEAGVIVVMDKIRVTEKGVIEGSGPAADRVKDVYQRFISETE